MFRYFLLYKPFQVLSQFSPEGDKETLADYCTDIPKDVYPAGRLDYDSEGLLLLTNDKKITQQLLEPRYKHQRTYYVQVEGIFDAAAQKKLEQGIEINVGGKMYRTLPAKVTLLDGDPALPERNPPIRFRRNIPTSWISITLHEGKNRQVRKMTAAGGFPTLRLVRYAIGAFTVAGWSSGELREVSADTIGLLLQKNH